MAIVESTACGILEVADEDIINFPLGIPGFESSHRFVLIHPSPEAPFSYLQATDQGELAFVVIDPFSFYKEYEFELAKSDQFDLMVEREDQIVLFVILTVGTDIHEATANLFAPIVINMESRRGKQVVLHDSNYSTKQRLLPATQDDMAKGRG
ncbi:MAG: flagellar assembly protein FliW [Gorillibacterium sp.]|nr:flagellar assembly protein FliW [Gorillibacterium sp.]